MVIEFFIPLENIPTYTHQTGLRVNFKTKTFYKSRELQDLENLFMGHLIKHAPDKPLKAPVRLVVKWLFKSNKKHTDGTYKVTKPDTDGLLKTFKDCMEKCKFFVNDSHVASEINEKFYSDISGIYVKVEEI